jgi:UDP-glucose:(heptosyl)LPS alpha-1,3-glucosyltransferase
MRLAFCLFKYSPYGGLERDFLRILETAIEHGHEVKVFLQQWQGKIPQQLKHRIELIPHSIFAFSNHARVNEFIQELSKALKNQSFDYIIGFNRLPNLDFYFAADCCYRAETDKKHGAWYSFLPRYQTFSAIEKSVFSPDAKTRILLLNPDHENDYIKYYQTPRDRFIHLLPGIGNDRQRPVNQISIRTEFRKSESVLSHENIILMVCSNFKLKGVERAIHAFSSLPAEVQKETYLWIVGNGHTKTMKSLILLAKKLGINMNQLKFFGGRKDIVSFYAAADILLHPALQETAGLVLLEALVATLPIIVTANCGYARIIQKANAGTIIQDPFQQEELNNALLQLLLHSEKRELHQRNALEFTATHNLFQLNEQVLEIIENADKK